MSTDGRGRPEDRSEDDEPLLPTLRQDPVMDQALRESLKVLRDTATDDDVRRRISAVLEGRESLRDLARDGGFAALVDPLAERGWQQWDELPDDEKERLAARRPDDEPPPPPRRVSSWG